MAQSRRARGRLGLMLDWPGAREDQQAGEQWSAQYAAPGPAGPERAPSVPGSPARARGSLGHADRFEALLHAGRAIAAATSVGAVRRAVEDAIVAVLRAEHALVFEVRASEPVLADAGSVEMLDEPARSLIAQAIATGEVVTAAPGLDARVAPSLALSGARAALCAPISRTGRITGAFYAVQRHRSGGFGDEEQRLAAFIAAVAGATLEHVAGSEAHFRALVRNSHDLTIVTDATGRNLYVSPSVTTVLGYAPSDFGRLDSQLVHPDDRERSVHAFRLARFSPATHPATEIRARHRDGSWRWLEMTISNHLADPAIRGLVLNIRDITDRKGAEVALEQATEQFRLAFENAPIGMAMTTTFSAERRYRRADGHWIWVQLAVSMVAGDDGPRKYVVSQMLETTQRRATEERLTFLALHDPLTGLANRRLLLDRLSVTLARAARSGRMAAVLYLEFVLVADDIDGPAEALALARRIQESFHDRFDVGGGAVSVTASVGIALSAGHSDPATVLRQADAAMYQAKERGRARHHLHGGDGDR